MYADAHLVFPFAGTREIRNKPAPPCSGVAVGGALALENAVTGGLERVANFLDFGTLAPRRLRN